MGRGKLAMELITKEKARISSFQKRKKSLFKKASELSVLCDVKVCVIVNSIQNTTNPSKTESENWPENPTEVAQIVANYEAKCLASRCKTASDLATFFLDRQRKAINKAQSVQKMVIEAKFPDWDDRLNCFSSEQLIELLHVIDRKITVVDHRLNGLLTMQAHLFSILGQYSGPEQLLNPNTIFQPDNGNSGCDWICEYPEISDNLSVLDNEILHLQMQPQIEFPMHLIDYPTTVTPLQTWPPLLPNASIPSLPFHPPCHTPWPDLINVAITR